MRIAYTITKKQKRCAASNLSPGRLQYAMLPTAHKGSQPSNRCYCTRCLLHTFLLRNSFLSLRWTSHRMKQWRCVWTRIGTRQIAKSRQKWEDGKSREGSRDDQTRPKLKFFSLGRVITLTNVAGITELDLYKTGFVQHWIFTTLDLYNTGLVQHWMPHLVNFFQSSSNLFPLIWWLDVFYPDRPLSIFCLLIANMTVLSCDLLTLKKWLTRLEETW